MLKPPRIKQIIYWSAAITFAATVSWFAGNHSSSYEVTNTATTTVEIHPDWATDQEAVEAAQGVIRKKELEADKNRLEGQIEALESELEVIEKELGLY